MPNETGSWTYITSSNLNALHNKKGKFECYTEVCEIDFCTN